jgi:integrase
MPVFNITDQSLLDYRLPEGVPKIELCCSQVKGFVANVSASRPGEATLVFKFKDNGKTARRPLGRFPEVDVESARVQARQLKEEHRQGVDIGNYLAAPGCSPTLADFVVKVWLPAQKERVKINTYKMYEGMTRLYLLPALGKTPMDKISKREVTLIITELRQRGLSAATANRALASLRACYNSAIELSMVDFNPASKVKLYKEPLKERYLSEAELGRLLQVLETDDNQAVCRVVRFALFTGGRIGEILKTRSKDISLEQETWFIPAAHSKSGRSRTVPLNRYALEVVRELDLNHPSGNVFIGRLGEPLREVRKVWDRIRKKAALPDLNLHSCRHQMASMMVNSGRTLYEVQKVLGHTSSRTTERYSHLQAATLRQATDSISHTIDKALAKNG